MDLQSSYTLPQTPAEGKFLHCIKSWMLINSRIIWEECFMAAHSLKCYFELHCSSPTHKLCSAMQLSGQRQDSVQAKQSFAVAQFYQKSFYFHLKYSPATADSFPTRKWNLFYDCKTTVRGLGEVFSLVDLKIRNFMTITSTFYTHQILRAVRPRQVFWLHVQNMLNTSML